MKRSANVFTKIVDGLLAYRLLNDTNLPEYKQKLFKVTVYERKCNVIKKTDDRSKDHKI